jgi:hypothetical protein
MAYGRWGAKKPVPSASKRTRTVATVWVTRELAVFPDRDRVRCLLCLGLCDGRVPLVGLDSELVQLRLLMLLLPLLLMLPRLLQLPMTENEGQASLGVQSMSVRAHHSLHANAVRYGTRSLQYRAIGRKTERWYKIICAMASRAVVQAALR